MAEPRESYPGTATNGARKAATNGDGEAALRDALAAHGEDLAGLVEATDEGSDALATAILIAASADAEEIAYISESTSNLITAVDGLSTEEAATLATEVGDNADDLSDSLETVLDLQREGHLDDLTTVATAFAESLSPEEVEELSSMLEANGTDIVEALDIVLDLQREDQLTELVELAGTLSALDIDEDTVHGLNTVFGAIGEAERESEPIGFVGAIKQLGNRDVRAGLGYLVALLKAQGRRLRNQ